MASLWLASTYVGGNVGLPTDNSTSEFHGAGLYNLGWGILQNGTAFQNNTMRQPHGAEAIASTAYNGGNLWYVLPLPLGMWAPASFECQPSFCTSPESYFTHHQERSLCSMQNCPIELYTGLFMAPLRRGPEPAHGSNAQFPYHCAPGHFGSSRDPQSQASSQCQGPCPAGCANCSPNAFTCLRSRWNACVVTCAVVTMLAGTCALPPGRSHRQSHLLATLLRKGRSSQPRAPA